MDTLNTNPLLQYLIPGFDNLSSRFQLILSIIPFSEIVFWLVIFLLAIGVFSVVLYLVHKFVLVYLQLKETYTFLEVTPPKETLKSSYTTQQLFNLLHGLARQRSWWQRFIGNQKSYAFEIVSTKDDGIRYLLRVNEEDADLIKKSLLSYLPGLSVTVAKDYLPESFDTHKRIIAQFGLANHFAFPLKKQDELGEHDPIAYITGNMTKLSKDELVVFQLVASQSINTIPDIKHISHLIYANKDLISGLKAIRAAGLLLVSLRRLFF